MNHLRYFESKFLYINKNNDQQLYNRISKSNKVNFIEGDLPRIKSFAKNNLQKYRVFINCGILVIMSGKSVYWIEQFADEWFIIKRSYGDHYDPKNNSNMTFVIDGWDGMKSVIEKVII